jgi:predicted Kef-type K+ transport protein
MLLLIIEKVELKKVCLLRLVVCSVFVFCVSFVVCCFSVSIFLNETHQSKKQKEKNVSTWDMFHVLIDVLYLGSIESPLLFQAKPNISVVHTLFIHIVSK